MDKIILHKNSKYNKSNYTGFCTMCYEKALFRHVLFDGMNSIICTRCCTAKPLKKGLDEVPYMYTETINHKDKWVRAWIRTVHFFTGTWNRSRFSFKILIGR